MVLIWHACLDLWGFLYLGFLFWMFYRLKRGHNHTTHTFWVIVLSQFFFSHIEYDTKPQWYMGYWEKLYEPASYPMHSAVIGVVLLLLCLEPFFMKQFRKQAIPPGVSDSLPQR